MSARIVFDLDGTLIDSAPDIQGIANAALATVGADPITLEDTHSFIGEGIDNFVKGMRAARGLSDYLHAQLLADLVARYPVTLLDTRKTLPGLRLAQVLKRRKCDGWSSISLHWSAKSRHPLAL